MSFLIFQAWGIIPLVEISSRKLVPLFDHPYSKEFFFFLLFDLLPISVALLEYREWKTWPCTGKKLGLALWLREPLAAKTLS